MSAPKINENSDLYYDLFKSKPGQDLMGPIVNWLETQETTPEPFDFWPKRYDTYTQYDMPDGMEDSCVRVARKLKKQYTDKGLPIPRMRFWCLEKQNLEKQEVNLRIYFDRIFF